MAFGPIDNDLNSLATVNSEQRRSARRKYQRRSSRRIPLVRGASVRFFIDENEHEGTLVDVSKSGVRVVAKARPTLNSKIDLYVEKLGRIRGLVVQNTVDGFSVKSEVVDGKLPRLQKWLTELMNGDILSQESTERRNSGRRSVDPIIAGVRDIYAERVSGAKVCCEIAYLSADGVEIFTDAHFDIGEKIFLDGTASIVTQKTPDGYRVCHRK